MHLCGRKIPRILLHRLSSSMISDYKNDRVAPGDKPVDSSESITALYDPSEHLERMLQTPPPEPNFSASKNRLSSTIPHYKNERSSVSSDKSADSSGSITALYDTSPSGHLERIPPMSTGVLNSDDASARSAGKKRPSSEREVSPDIPRKASRSGVS